MDVLDEIMTEAQGPEQSSAVSSLPGVSVDKPAIQKVNYSHAAMIDMILAQPWISQNALAARFGYTASWVSQVLASDAFQAALHKRAKEVVDPTLLATVQERFEAIVLRSQEILLEKLAKPSDVVPDQLVIQSLATASRARGYGAKVDTPPTPSEVHVHLEGLGSRLTTLLTRKRTEIIDAQVEEIAGAAAEG